MSLLKEKLLEVLSAVVPIMAIVILLSVFLVPVEAMMMGRFLIGAVFLIVGLAIFLLGVDTGMTPIGEHLGGAVTRSKSLFGFFLLAFLIGFGVTVAEPDMMILARQVSEVSGSVLSANLIVYVVSGGVGVLIALGVFRILKDGDIRVFFLLAYSLILVLSFFAEPEFIAVGFDSSGATTGALTTPFILALCASVSMLKGGKNLEEDSFGLVGAMSAGPIVAVLLMSIIRGSEFSGSSAAYEYSEGLFRPFFEAIPHVALESVIALLPITGIFFYLRLTKLKISKREILRICIGLIYTLVGLVIFLVGVNQGFMDLGRFLGASLARDYATYLPLIGLVIGLVVVLAEPAVSVLGKQVEDITGGFIKHRVLNFSLSIGVGLAVALSLLKIQRPELQLWHFLLPGFGLAIVLSFFTSKIFTGIAFDAGGVASGPMTATFVLAFAQGVAENTAGADVLRDGFGIIAMVAMAPVLAIQCLGLVFRFQMARIEKQKRLEVEAELALASAGPETDESL